MIDPPIDKNKNIIPEHIEPDEPWPRPSKKNKNKKKSSNKNNSSTVMSIAYKIQHYTNKVYEYIKEFGLFNWEVHVEEIEDEECRGEIQYDIPARLAIIYYDKTWIEDIELLKDEIELVAFHEVCELFLSDIHTFIFKHGDSEQADGMIHNVIRFMENKILKGIK